MAIAFIPTMLRELTGGAARVEVDAATLCEVVARLDERFPGIADALIEDAVLRPGVTISTGGEGTTNSLAEPVGPDTEVHFLLAISGG
jgi:hypothetical protein